jgi:hypothetical protein
MTTTIDVITDGSTTSLTDEDPFFVESIEGVGAAPGHLIENRGPQQHGSTVEGYRLDPREIELVVGFLSSDGLSDPVRDTLLALFKFRTSSAALRITRDDGTIRQIDWHLRLGPLLGRTGRDLDVQRAAVVLRCADPRWYDPEGVGVNFGLGGGGDAMDVPLAVPMEVGASALDQTTVIAYAGDAAEYPIITIDGPITNCVITHLGTGDELDFTGVTIGVGESRVIDLRYGHKTLVDETGAISLGDLTDESDIATFHLGPDPEVPGGNNAIQVTGTGVTAATAVSLVYYNRYTGV